MSYFTLNLHGPRILAPNHHCESGCARAFPLFPLQRQTVRWRQLLIKTKGMWWLRFTPNLPQYILGIQFFLITFKDMRDPTCNQGNNKYFLLEFEGGVPSTRDEEQEDITSTLHQR